IPPLPPAPASSVAPRSAAPVRSGGPAVRAGAAAFRAPTAEHWRAASGFASAHARDGATWRHQLAGLVSRLSLLLLVQICTRLAQFGGLVRQVSFQNGLRLLQHLLQRLGRIELCGLVRK